MSYNAKTERTFRINGSLKIDSDLALFVQGMTITIDAGVLQRDSIGDGTSVFTQNGDVIGSFSFKLKNTTDIWDPTDPSVTDKFVSKWMEDISNFDPTIVTFVQTFNAPKGTDEKFVRITFKGRIMAPQTDMSVDNAIEDLNVTGEITEFTSAQRVAS